MYRQPWETPDHIRLIYVHGVLSYTWVTCPCGVTGDARRPWGYGGWSGRLTCANCGRTTRAAAIALEPCGGGGGDLYGEIPEGPMPLAVARARLDSDVHERHVEAGVRALVHVLDGGKRNTYPGGPEQLMRDLDDALHAVVAQLPERERLAIVWRHLRSAPGRRHG